MSVWIRSQDGGRLINCKNLYIGVILTYDRDFGQRGIYENGIKNALGEYSSGEKALKVLDMIQQHIKTRVNEDMVFQMPSNEEVKV